MSDDQATVLAIDPGGTTGWSMMSVPPEALSDPKVSILENLTWGHGQVDSTDERDAVCHLCELALGRDHTVILIEDFTIRRFDQSTDFLSPVRITAMLDFALWSAGIATRTYRQQPSEAKGVATDSRLKEWGLYERTGGLEHARDADRHAITWLRKAKDLKTGAARRHEWWPLLFS